MSTPFTKQNLIVDGAWVVYSPSGDPDASDSKFVGRFKYHRSTRNTFMTFLRRNFTVEEYFARRYAGKDPIDIDESKGYVMPHIKRRLKEDGYPQTAEGWKAWNVDQAAARAHS